MQTLDIVIVQNSAGSEEAENLVRLDALIADIAGVDIIAFPEVLAIRGADADYRNAAQPLDGTVATHLAALARSRHTWVLAGSLIERDGDHVYNTCVLFNRQGAIAATYRKMHLFESRLEDGTHIREADAYEPGHDPVLVDIDGWKAGLAICYDLRFPELFRFYTSHGAQILFVPSNFTQRTGKDHWDVLVRARAIENQCFVAAPNQCGSNPVTGVTSHGHSMVVDPWGGVLCRADTEEGLLRARLEPEALMAVRNRVPALEHRVSIGG